MLIKKTIDGALRLIGVLAAGEEASSDEHEDGLERLNGLIDSFNTQSLLVSYISHNIYSAPTLGWKSNITFGIGTSFDFNVVAPIQITSAFFRYNSGIDRILKLNSLDQWAGISNKYIITTPSNYFVQYGPDKSMEIQFDSIPLNTDVLHIMCRMPFVAASGMYLPTDDINWDYGFERMLRYNLAVELSSEYGQQISPIVASIAQKSLRDIKQSNYQPIALKVDSGLTNRTANINLTAALSSGWNW